MGQVSPREGAEQDPGRASPRTGPRAGLVPSLINYLMSERSGHASRPFCIFSRCCCVHPGFPKEQCDPDTCVSGNTPFCSGVCPASPRMAGEGWLVSREGRWKPLVPVPCGPGSSVALGAGLRGWGQQSREAEDEAELFPPKVQLSFLLCLSFVVETLWGCVLDVQGGHRTPVRP